MSAFQNARQRKNFSGSPPRGEEFANSQLPALIFVRTCRATARRGHGKELTILRLPALGAGKRLNAESETGKHR